MAETDTLCGLEEVEPKSWSFVRPDLIEDVVPRLLQYSKHVPLYLIDGTTDCLSCPYEGDIPKARETAIKANTADPVGLYIKETPVNRVTGTHLHIYG